MDQALEVSGLTGQVITVPSDYEPTESDWLLLGMITQNLTKDADGYYDTGFIRIHKSAMEYLCGIELMEPHPAYINDSSPFRDFMARKKAR